MRLTGEMICDNFQIIRCFDFLNHIDNMRPFAEVALSRRDVVFEPAISCLLYTSYPRRPASAAQPASRDGTATKQ